MASYVLVFMLPILLMSLLVFQYVFYCFEKEVIKNNESALNNVMSTIDTKIDELNRITYQIFYNTEISSYFYTGNPVKGMEVIKVLKNSILANKFIHEVILYTGESNFLLSSSGSFSIQNFTTSIYNYSGWNSKDFIEGLTSNSKSYFRPVEDVLTSTGPRRLTTGIFTDPTQRQKSVIFLIEEDSILQTLKSFRGNTLIMDENYRIIAATEPQAAFDSDTFLSFVKSGDSSGFKLLKLENTDYFISFVQSSSTKWTYATLIPVEQVFGDLKSVKSVFIYGLIVVFILEVILILAVTRYNYNPIKQLKAFAEKHYGKSISSVNEFDAVKLTINSISESNLQLKEKMRISQPALRDFMLTSLLKGNFKDINNFNKTAGDVGLCFTKPYYQVAVFFINNYEQYSPVKDDISSELEKNLPEGLEGYCKNNIEDNKLVMILSSDSENGPIVQQMEVLKEYLVNQWDIFCTIGVSQSCEDISQIWKLYIEASTALDYRLILGNNNIILFHELNLKTGDYSFYSGQYIESLSACIENANFDKAGKLIDELVEKIKHTASLFMARCICFDIVNSIIRTVYSINKSFVINGNDYFDLMSLMKFETAEELSYAVKTFCFDICEYIKTIKSDSKSTLFNSIKTYIDIHCCDLDFTIQATAEHFRMSLSNLGQYFKSHMGITVSEYVGHLQIEKAKELLRTTDESIQNIVKKAGHYDSSNFIRKFKQIVGMTPGEYRKMSSK